MPVEIEHVQSSTQELRSVKPERKGCLHHHDDGVRLRHHQPSYSEGDCFLECALAPGAGGSCGCAPWYLQAGHFPDARMYQKFVRKKNTWRDLLHPF